MRKFRLLIYIFIIGFLLNLIWENVQAPLYEGYTNLWDHFMMCFWASIVDAAVILLLYALFALWFKNSFWIKHLNWKNGLLLMLVGAAIALGFEFWAFQNEVWAYTERMPLVPALNIGLSPLLQMMLLPLFTFILSYRIVKS